MGQDKSKSNTTTSTALPENKTDNNLDSLYSTHHLLNSDIPYKTLDHFPVDEKSLDNCGCENNIPLLCCGQCQRASGIAINTKELTSVFVKWLIKFTIVENNKDKKQSFNSKPMHEYIAGTDLALIDSDKVCRRLVIIVSVYPDCPLHVEEKLKEYKWICFNRFKTWPGAFVHQ